MTKTWAHFRAFLPSGKDACVHWASRKALIFVLCIFVISGHACDLQQQGRGQDSKAHPLLLCVAAELLGHLLLVPRKVLKLHEDKDQALLKCSHPSASNRVRAHAAIASPPLLTMGGGTARKAHSLTYAGLLIDGYFSTCIHSPVSLMARMDLEGIWGLRESPGSWCATQPSPISPHIECIRHYWTFDSLPQDIPGIKNRLKTHALNCSDFWQDKHWSPPFEAQKKGSPEKELLSAHSASSVALSSSAA